MGQVFRAFDKIFGSLGSESQLDISSLGLLPLFIPAYTEPPNNCKLVHILCIAIQPILR